VIAEAIPVLIPLADGQGLASAVLAALVTQAVPVVLYCGSRPVCTENPRHSEGLSRLALVRAAMYIDAPAFVMMDRDVVLGPTVVARLAAAMDDYKNGSVGTIHARTLAIMSPPDHMNLGIFAYRRDVADLLVKAFDRPKEVNTCHCESLTNVLRGTGWSQKWLSDTQEAVTV
jgi:hypothetical protein